MKEVSPIWIRRVEGAVSRLQEIPLWGYAPAFPWEKVSERLKEMFGAKSLQIRAKQTRFLSSEELFSNLGEDPTLVPLELTPLEGQAFWAMPKSEVEKLTMLFLTQEGTSKGFVSEPIRNGYVHFLFLKALHILNEEYAFGDLTTQVAPLSGFPEGALCLDLSIKIGQETLWARVICSETLVEAFNRYFISEKSTLFSGQSAPDLPLPLNLTIGRTALSYASWQKIERGDLLLLDQCSFDPSQEKGSGLLTLNGTPLFDVRIKENEVKILEYAFYQEETPMTRNKEEGEETLPPEKSEEDRHLWSSEEGSPAEKLLSSHEIPLVLTVEVARMTLPLAKVVQLKPGNLLDLKVNPELTVSLTVNGKRVAKGELVKMGESIGVKILALHE